MWEHSAEERKKFDCSMEWTSTLIYMRNINAQVYDVERVTVEVKECTRKYGAQALGR
jgi:hypothetical protein